MAMVGQVVLNILDILLVTYLFYQLFLLVKGTRATEILTGLVILVIATVVVKTFLPLKTLGWLLEQFWRVAVILVVVVFQPEIRSALAQLGSRKFSRLILGPSNLVEEIVQAIEFFVKKRWGALIVLERETGLRNFISSGIIIKARVKSELLETIFYPGTPLHDGAVIISRSGILEAAACVLPLSSDLNIPAYLGTRHRAALGLSEISDAIIIVVSEETGKISIVSDRKLEYDLSAEDLRKKLQEIFRNHDEKFIQ